MMKNKLIVITCGLLLSSGFALGHGDFTEDLKPYIGAGFGYNKYSYSSQFKTNLGATSSIKNHALSGDLLGGVKFHDHFAAEIGYSFHGKVKITATGNSNYDTMKANNLYVDLVGFECLKNDFDVIGMVGLGRMKAKYTTNTGAVFHNEFNKGKTGLRLGAGVRYNIDENFAIRGTLNYQGAGMKDDHATTPAKAIKSACSLKFALTYSFN